MPRVSRPALPASERKQGLCAVSLMGSCVGVQDLLAHGVGQRDLGGADQVLLGLRLVAAARDPEHVFLELGQLARCLPAPRG
jgi:hypothetical protein